SNRDRQIGESLHALDQPRCRVREALPHTGHTRARNGVYKPAAGFAYEPDSLICTCGSDEEYQIDPCFFHRYAKVIGFFRDKISAEHSVNTGTLKLIAKPAKSNRQKRIEITEKDYWDLTMRADTAYQFEAIAHTYVVGQRSLRGSLNNRPVGHRIRKRHTQLNNVSSAAFQL